jgi:branched-chain amino acid aminotransferase
VVVPIGKLLADDFEIVHEGPQSAELAMSLRDELTGIQYGRVQDRHGWMLRLDA